MITKPTLTIGIPILNEENTIHALVESIVQQKQTSYFLKQIIIYMDGSNQSTQKVVKQMKLKFPLVNAVYDKCRKGKTYRLNRIYKTITTDFIMTLDGDILLNDENTIENLIQPLLKNPDIVVTAPKSMPHISKNTFIGLITFSNHIMWNYVKEELHKKDNIYHLTGQCVMLSREFAKQIEYPSKLTCDQAYLYAKIKQAGKKFEYVKNAVTYINMPTNFYDFTLLLTRSEDEQDIVMQYFDSSVKQYYYLPTIIKIKGIIRSFFCINPVFLIFAIMFNVIVKLFPKHDMSMREGFWIRADSTKHKISLQKK